MFKMINPILIIPLIISFFITLLTLPYWIKKCKKSGLLWDDMNKIGSEKKVAFSGGIVVMISFVIGVLIYIAIRTFAFDDVARLDLVNLSIFTLLSVILILTIVGITDDILGWKHKGLSTKIRIFLALMASIPLIVINAGNSIISLPFFGAVNFGIFYLIILIPVGIAGATIVYNFLAGFNGLEAGQGIIIIGFLSIVAYLTENPWLSVVGGCMVVSLLAFYFFNRYPAKVFPGDSLTWPIGALIAVMAILGNFEKIAVFFFIPYIIEVFLKARGGLRMQSFGKPNKDNSLELLDNKIYGLTHFSIWFLKKFKKKVYEKEVVYFINFLQIITILFGLIIFRQGIF